MLEGLESIDWKNLIHEDVPIWIRGLASEDEQIREAAYDNLYDLNLFDGSIHYVGVPYIIPFFVELLNDKHVQEKDSILRMLMQLLNAAIATMEVVPDSEEAKQIHDKVTKETSLYKTFLKSEDEFVRGNAELLLSFIEVDT